MIKIFVVWFVEKDSAQLQITQKYSNVYHQNLFRILATNTEFCFKSSLSSVRLILSVDSQFQQL